jgi:kinesin family member 18A
MVCWMALTRLCLRTGQQAVGKPTQSGPPFQNSANDSGTPDNPGLIYLTTQELFDRCDALTDKKIDISLSFLEIYNETIRDLLVPPEESKPLLLREDAKQKISVPGLTTAKPITVSPLPKPLTLGGRSDELDLTRKRESYIFTHGSQRDVLALARRTAD